MGLTKRRCFAPKSAIPRPVERGLRQRLQTDSINLPFDIGNNVAAFREIPFVEHGSQKTPR